MAKKSKINFTYIAAGVIALIIVAFVYKSIATTETKCPGSQVFCPGVGCVSGMDKCIPGSRGGPNAIFSKETFQSNFFDETPAPVKETNYKVMKYKMSTHPALTPIKEGFQGKEYSLPMKTMTFPDFPKQTMKADTTVSSGVVNKCPDGTRTDGPCLMEF